MALFGSQKELEKHVTKLLKNMAPHDGFIFNLGHGILPETPRDNVKFVVDLVKNA